MSASETTFVVTYEALAEAVRQVGPFACADLTLPMIAVVRFETYRGDLYAAATDRYGFGVHKLARLRERTDGPVGKITLRPDMIEVPYPNGVKASVLTPDLRRVLAVFRPLAKDFRHSAAGYPLRVTYTDRLFVVEDIPTGDVPSTRVVIDRGDLPKGNGSRPFPRSAPIFRDALKATDDTHGVPLAEVGLNPSFLARFATVARPHKGEPIIVRQPRKPSAPIVVTIPAASFVGLLMPIRIEGDRWGDWREAFADDTTLLDGEK